MRYSLYEQLEWHHAPDEWSAYPNMLLHYDEKQGEFTTPGSYPSTTSRINKLDPKPRKDGVIIVTDFEVLDDNNKKVTNVAIPETHPAYNTRLFHWIENKCKSFNVEDLVSKVINNVVRHEI